MAVLYRVSDKQILKIYNFKLTTGFGDKSEFGIYITQ